MYTLDKMEYEHHQALRLLCQAEQHTLMRVGEEAQTQYATETYQSLLFSEFRSCGAGGTLGMVKFRT